jgi:hypothetical protein
LTAARRRAVTAVTALAVGAFAGACGGKQKEAAVDTAATAPPAVAAADTCPKVGAWRPCSVRDRLERAGLAPIQRDSVRPPYLSVPGAVYGVGAGQLQVYLYADSTARRRDFAKFDTARVQPADTLIQWPAHPTLITSNNLAAILLSDNETQVERVQLALTAGLPRQ